MIQQTATASEYTLQHAHAPRKVLRMVENDRMAGSVPKWEVSSSPAQDIESALGGVSQNRSFDQVLNSALGYNEEPQAQASAQPEEFGFADLVDMVNPLQHIPVVGHLYREFTGDDIRPIGQIVGGALFGGPLGAAGGLVNAIIEEETGKDMTGNALAFMFKDEQQGQSDQISIAQDTPENRLGSVMLAMEEGAPIFGEPAEEGSASALLSFSDLKSSENVRIIRGAPDQEDWTSDLPPREPITRMKL